MITSLAFGHPSSNYFDCKWEVKPLGAGYSIRSVLNGRYLTVENGANDGAHIIATPYPVSWSVEPFYAERESWRYELETSMSHLKLY